MTHIENIPHILENGITHIYSKNANKDYKGIGDGSLINTRHNIKLPNNDLLGDYIPFYFGTRMPMLLVIQKGYNSVTPKDPADIVYCVTSVERVLDCGLEFIFSDGHAVNGLTSFYEQEEIDGVEEIVDLKAVKVTYWKDENDNDLKRRMEAEFLVKEDIPPDAIGGFIVYNEAAKARLLSMGVKENIVAVRPNRYF